MSRPYELEPIGDVPDVPEGVVVHRAPEESIEAAAADMFFHAMNCVRAFGDFNMALSGGTTPVRLYQALMLDPQFRAFPWKRTHLWVVSEPVGGAGEHSASELLSELIATHSDIPRDQFHPIDPTAGADGYAATLRETLGWREPGHDRLDYVLLGLGADGSTAGLARDEDVDDAALVHETGPAHRRHVSLGVRTINAARLIAVVAFGSDKHRAVRRVIGPERQDSAPPMPIDRISPVGGELRWYLDAAALNGVQPS